MVWPYPKDVILYARSSYYYNNIFIIYFFFQTLFSFYNLFWSTPKKLQERLHYVTFLDITSLSFLSLVPCLKI